MQPSKFVVKCGSFAVLVDLHILPLPGEDNNAWFSQEHREEVSGLIKDAVDHRVRQFLEARQVQSKQKRDLSAHNPLCIKGGRLRLAAYFVKRHVNLRCVIRQNCHRMRVFPERFVVCASRPDNTTFTEGIKLDMTEQTGQSRSGYFSSPSETPHPLNSSTITKRAALQKIARQVDTHPPPEPQHEIHDQYQNQETTLTPKPSAGGTEVVELEEEATAHYEGDKVRCKDDDPTEKIKPSWEAEDQSDHCPGVQASEDDHILQSHETTRRRRRLPSSPSLQKAKRVCLREPLAATRTHRGSTLEDELEEELHGKQTPHPPLSTSPAKHITQSRLAASLKGQSARAGSSGSCVSSRSAAEEKQSVPRISRLRRLKKS